MLIERTVRVKLTDEDKDEYRRRNAEIDLHMIRAKEKLDEAKADFKAETEGIKKEKQLKLQILRSGFTEKNMQVMEFWDNERGVVDYMDPETQAVVDSRDMTPKERSQYRLQMANS